jgi:hypothetical protein
MNLTTSQRAVLVVGLVLTSLAFIFVPFEARFSERTYEAHAYIGYYSIWDPPDAAVYCAPTFGLTDSSRATAIELCTAKPIYQYVILTALAAISTMLAAFFLMGGLRRRTV